MQKASSLARLTPRMRGGLIVAAGRLKNAQVSEDARCPVILPKDHHVSELLVRHIHQRSGHSGREYVVAELRQKYWVTGATSLVKKVLSGCVTCRRRSAQPGGQQMADLPADRVTPGGPAFTKVGVDYFGPFAVKRGRGTEKRYGCLFTCLTTRAVHIEVAHSLTTSSFLNCLYRFMARRGRPQLIRSDNGLNFVGAERELRRALDALDQGRIRDQLLDRGIQWMFNPPHASHMGGVWERQIRTVRRVLDGLTREQRMDDDMLHTLMTTAEGIVNDRPITTVSSDPSDLEALTPNHLLLLRPATAPPGLFRPEDLDRKKRWRQVQYLADLFWRRWTREYLPLLRRRTKWTEPGRNVQAGDVVLVHEHMLPRNEWSLGRVVEVYPGADGLVRVAKVRTKNTELVRPVAKLSVLEETAH